ncbi:MAG: hypothetical protein IT431_11650 [Phycisphaerales bacterium]|nr:hypothetical protein [Phycisphaerales bacterium]
MFTLTRTQQIQIALFDRLKRDGLLDDSDLSNLAHQSANAWLAKELGRNPDLCEHSAVWRAVQVFRASTVDGA